MKNGSVDSLKVCERCGASANARQIREIADCDFPVAAAIDAVAAVVDTMVPGQATEDDIALLLARALGGATYDLTRE
jgi:hypothetical protein